MTTPLRQASARPTRRRVLAAAAGLTASIAMGSAKGATGDLALAIAAYAGRSPVREGKVRLDVADLVDNGNVVPVTVTVDSAMSAADHVRAIAIFNEKNPQRDVARFTLGQRSGKASVSTRIRLASTQKLVAVAQMSDGSFWSHTVDVIITLAACVE